MISDIILYTGTFFMILTMIFCFSGIFYAIYIKKKYLLALRNNINFIKSLSNRILFFGYEVDDGLIANIAFINKVSSAIDKSNINKVKKCLGCKIAKSFQFYNKIFIIASINGCLFLLFIFMYSMMRH